MAARLTLRTFKHKKRKVSSTSVATASWSSSEGILQRTLNVPSKVRSQVAVATVVLHYMRPT